MDIILQFLLAVLVTLLPSGIFSATIDPSCDYFQNMQAGTEYFLYNEGYSSKSKKSCRWTGESPQGTVIVLSCNEVELPYSTDCQRDKLAFSPYGEENVDNAEKYCGSTSFTAYTEGNRFVLTFAPNPSGTGGKFLCSAAVMRTDCGRSCGFRSKTKIVGGTETGVNEFPSMAGLYDISREDLYCGGSIISNRYALTAAHCLLHQVADNLVLVVGDHNIKTNSDTAYADKIPIQSFKSHPYYDQASQHNDIAVVKTIRVIQFNLAVNAICLPFTYRDYNFLGETVTALGWGFQDFSGNKSDTLQKVDLGVVSNHDCDVALVETIDSTQMCTYADGKDACLSDSGGPVIWQDTYTGKLELVGCISFGLACATYKPAVHTRVTAYLAWIASVTSDAAFCIQ